MGKVVDSWPTRIHADLVWFEGFELFGSVGKRVVELKFHDRGDGKLAVGGVTVSSQPIWLDRDETEYPPSDQRKTPANPKQFTQSLNQGENALKPLH